MANPKKKISKATVKAIIADFKTQLGDRLIPLGTTDIIIETEVLAKVLAKHFDIVDVDPDEIECSPMGDGFAL